MNWKSSEGKSVHLLDREASNHVTRELPSGRRIVLDVEEDEERIYLYSPDGEIEVRIALDENGPVVHLRGARLELEAVEKLAIHCKELAIQADERAELRSGGSIQFHGDEIRLLTSRDIHLNGAFVRLNCPPNVERALEPAPHHGP